MTKEEFLARCANAFDAGLCTPQRLRILDRWTDFALRYNGVHLGQTGQDRYLFDHLECESRRTAAKGFQSGHRTLASDTDGYALIQMSAILNHPCQICAVDPKAWWTRSAMCPHRGKS